MSKGHDPLFAIWQRIKDGGAPQLGRDEKLILLVLGYYGGGTFTEKQIVEYCTNIPIGRIAMALGVTLEELNRELER